MLEIVRDLAVTIAAVGVAWWAWDRYSGAARRQDEAAQDRTARDRLGADLRQAGARMEALAVDISTRLDEVLGRGRDAEARSAVKIAVHRVLMASKEPFLTFTEVRDGLARGAGGSAPATPVDEAELRRCLMELVADAVVAQLERDRYFIASDFDADEAPGNHS